MVINNSIIIPTYKINLDIFKQNIESVLNNITLTHNEIIIVSNGQTDIFNNWLYDNFSNEKNIKLLFFDKPLGYVKAVNSGVKASIGDYIVLMNDDVFFNYVDEKDYHLYLLKEPFLYNKNCGISGPRCNVYMYKFNRMDHIADFIVFFFAMIKRELFSKIGLLNEDFNIGGYDDFEYSERAKFFGYDICNVPYGKNVLQMNQYLLPIQHYKSLTLNTINNLVDILQENYDLFYKIIKKKFGYEYMKQMKYLYDDSLYKYVVELIKEYNQMNNKLSSIIEFGCRYGIFIKYIYGMVDKYLGIDKDFEKIKNSSKQFNSNNITFLCYDVLINKLYLKKIIDEYDIIVSVDVFHYSDFDEFKYLINDKKFIFKFKDTNFILHNIDKNTTNKIKKYFYEKKCSVYI